MRGRLHLAPLPQDLQSAIDLGTGTGLWALDFADLYPSCEVCLWGLPEWQSLTEVRS